jgi:GNAT superfamily N-acetyltransferase
MEVSSFQKGNDIKIVDLLELVFDDWPYRDLDCTSKIEHWNWKYLDNPIGLFNIGLAWEKNKLVGCDHCYYLRVKIGDETFLCGIGADSAVHPEHRKKGIYTKMADLTKGIFNQHRANLAYWITTNPIFIESAKNKELPIFPHNIMKMMRINDMKQYLSETNSEHRFVKEIGYNIVSKMKLMKNLINHDAKKNYRPTRMRDIKYFDERINTFWHGIEDHYSFIIKRDQDYLNYRYNDSRGGKYIVKILEDDKEILGYIVSGTRRNNGYETGFIVDLLSKPNRIDVAKKLLSEALEQFDDKGINVVKSWIIKNHPYDQLFRKKGFIDSKRASPFVVFNLTSVGNEWNKVMESRPENIHFAMGDLDII